ncbi:hypothetical protein D3C78_864720 [compost metagenome]
MMIEEATEIGERILDSDEVPDDVVFRLRFLLRFANDRADAGENLHIGSGPALRNGALLHTLEEGLVFLQRSGIGEDRIRVFASKTDAGIGRACLEHHRLTLWRTLDVQRAFHLEEAALVAERVELGAVEKLSRLAVTQESVIVPAVPQALDNLEVFIGDLVTQRMFGVIAAVIFRRAFERCRHGIPPGTAAAQKIERGKLAGNGEGVAIGGRNGSRQADLRGDGGERRKDRQRLEPVEEMRNGLVVDVKPIRHEGEGDAGCFRLQRVLSEKVEIDAGIDRAFGVSPGIHVPAGTLKHDAETDFLSRHVIPS